MIGVTKTYNMLIRYTHKFLNQQFIKMQDFQIKNNFRVFVRLI